MVYLARLSVLAGLFLACATTVWAEFTLTPGVEMRLEYDDNIYLDSDDEEDDIIAKVIPALLMKWETSRIDLSLDARISFEKYADHTDEDRIGPGESNQGSTLNALVKVYPDILFLRVTDTYQRVPIDEGGRGGEGNNVVNLTDSNRLAINPYLQFEPLSDLQMQLGYTYENLWYGDEDSDNLEDDGGSGDDAETHTYMLNFTKKLSPRTSLGLKASHLEYRPKNPDSTFVVGEYGTYEYDRDDAGFAVNYQAGERLKLRGGYGYSWLDYDVIENKSGSIWQFSADYEISDATLAGLAYSRDYLVSVEDGPSQTDTYTVYIEYEDRIRIRAELFASNSDYVEFDREDDMIGGALGGTLPFTDKNRIEWQLRYANYDQSGFEAEEFDRYGASAAFYHDISRGWLSLGYSFTENDSDLGDSDYTNNIVFLAANLTF